MNHRRIFFLAVSLVLVFGCAATTKVVDSKLVEEHEDKKYSKVLVLAITDKAELRQKFETELAATLDGLGVDAMASAEILPQDERPTKETVLAAIAETHVDAVFTVELAQIRVDKEAPVQVMTGLDAVTHPDYDGMMTHYVSGNSIPGTSETTVVEIDSGLWDVNDKVRVWHASSETYDPMKATADKDRQAFAQTVLGKLYEDTSFFK